MSQSNADEMREMLLFLDENRKGPTGILITKIYVNPETHRDLWQNADGFLRLIDGIFNETLQVQVGDVCLPVHFSLAFSVNHTFQIPIFTINLVFINEGESNLILRTLAKHLLDATESVTGLEPEIHFYPFEVFYALIDEALKPVREDIMLDDGKGVVDQQGLNWLNNLARHSFRCELRDLMNLRNSELGSQIIDIQTGALND